MEKKSIYKNLITHFGTSIWLTKMAEESILKKGAIEFKTIPNGIDEAVFNLVVRSQQEMKLDYLRQRKLFCSQRFSFKKPAKGWNNLLILLDDAKMKTLKLIF